MTSRIHWNRFAGKLPEGARYVGRPSRYGNPFKVGASHPEHGAPMTRAEAVTLFAAWLAAPERAELRDRARRELAGRDLACACPLDGGPCHAETLLTVANAPGGKL